MELRAAYDLLGLRPGASENQVREAYRDLAKVWHPDRYENDPRLQKKAEAHFAEINLAYQRIKSAGFPSAPATAREGQKQRAPNPPTQTQTSAPHYSPGDRAPAPVPKGPSPSTQSRASSSAALWVLGLGAALGGAYALSLAFSDDMDSVPPGSDSHETVRPEPEFPVTPIPVADTGPMVEVRITSEPPGAQVFPLGASIAKCDETPCKLTIDPRDGGSPIRRELVLRAPGHADATIEVSLRAPKPTYHAVLEPLPESDAGAETASGKVGKSGKSGDKTAGTARDDRAGRDKTGGIDKTDGGNPGPVGTGVILDPFKRKKSK